MILIFDYQRINHDQSLVVPQKLSSFAGWLVIFHLEQKAKV
jgi:hypothetical protein